ncbi:phage portal protein (plasmid) [Microtetraspora malaysiensis]|uniref:phage portal protein n=1 Tax=Microtetraspora malaysiensis TaxID=161358 RepID=UPI003D8F401E
MPLPDRNQEWPPPAVRQEMRLYSQWGAWYSGSPERLGEVYGGNQVMPRIGMDPKGWDKPVQYASGLAGKVARWFWGTPTPLGQAKISKLHIPIASDISATSADLLFSEPPTLKVPGKKGQARLDAVLHEAGVYGTLLEGAELDSAYGGVYLRVGWDTTMCEHPVVDALPPDAAVPEFHGGRLKAVTFWRVVHEDDGQVWRHLEKHERGRVYHGLYLGDDDHLGRAVPLQDHPATAEYAELVDADGGFDSGYDRGLLVHYVPNMRPHRTLRGTASGRSDYAGVEGLMDALDETWTSWMRDLRLAKARIIVPDVYLSNNGRGQGSMWDPDREIYTGLAMLPPPGGGNNMITLSQFNIRVAEHTETAKALFSQIVRGAGYSVQSFGESSEGGQARTATEIHMQRHRSYSTRGRKIGYWTPALAWLAEAMLSVDHAIFGTKVVADRAQVEWPDGVMPDPESLSRTLDMLNRAQTVSLDTKIRMLHPDWDDVQVRQEKERLRDELGLNVPDPAALDETFIPAAGDE